MSEESVILDKSALPLTAHMDRYRSIELAINRLVGHVETRFSNLSLTFGHQQKCVWPCAKEFCFTKQIRDVVDITQPTVMLPFLYGHHTFKDD